MLLYYSFLIILAITPSLIWLSFYLRKDAHPESNKMIAKVFILGMLATLPVIFIQIGFFDLDFSPIFNIFLNVAFVEEFAKYLAFKVKVLHSSELDEPLDVMLYLIIAALGFAAVENILNFLSPQVFKSAIEDILLFAGLRFILATFLHALASGLLGYFVALSFLHPVKRLYFMSVGFLLAILWHGLFNIAIIRISEDLNYVFTAVIILLSAAIIVSLGLKRLKKMPSVCLT